MHQYILHIGYSKTGTSAIQNYLSNNRQLLQQQGILYPDVKLYGAWTHCLNHNLFGSALDGRLGWYKLTPEDYLQQFEKQRNKSQATRVILSSESFLGAVQPWAYDDELSYWEAVERYVKKIYELFRKFDTKLILYIRRQDDWLESIINQTIKSGRLAPEKVRTSSVDELLKIYLPRLNYAKTLDIWAEVFGKEAIELGVYKKNKLFKKDIVADFCNRLNIDDSVLNNPSPNNTVGNRKLNRDVLEFKRILNLIERPKYQERVISEALFDLSSSEEDRCAVNYSLLETDKRKAICETFYQSNQKIRNEYFSVDSEDLFKYDSEDINARDDIYPGLNTEKGILLLLNLEKYLNSPTTRVKLFRHWLAEKLRKKSSLLHAVFRLPYYYFKR